MSNPDDQDDLLTQILHTFQSASDKTPDSNPIAVFLKSLLSFFQELLKPDPSDAPNEGGPNPGDPAAQGDFKKSAIDYFKNPANVAHIEGTWLDMQQKLDPNYATDPEHKRSIKAISPVEARAVVTSGFGHRDIKVGSSDHKGYDIASQDEHNPNVVAAMPGVVLSAGARAGFGNCVEIVDIYGEHQIYGHLQSFSVKKGESVIQGQEIAVMGNTGHVDKELGDGTHLHYEVLTVSGVAIKPKIMGRTYEKGQEISLNDSNQLLSRQKQQTDALLLAQAGKSPLPGNITLPPLPGLAGVTPSPSYQPAVTGGPGQGPRSAGM